MDVKDRCTSYSYRLSTTLSVNLNVIMSLHSVSGGRENITKEAEQSATSRTEAGRVSIYLLT